MFATDKCAMSMLVTLCKARALHTTYTKVLLKLAARADKTASAEDKSTNESDEKVLRLTQQRDYIECALLRRSCWLRAQHFHRLQNIQRRLLR